MIRKIGYGILDGIVHALARLPLRCLYLIADVLFLLIFYVVRYRRKVVAKNMSDSFPELSEDKRRRIIRDFYRNLADYIVETIKLLHISDHEIRRRMVFEGVDMIDGLFERGRSIAAYFSHCGNWEWAPSVTLWSRFKADEDAAFCQVYRPLRNEWFDSFMLRLRSRFNPRSFPKKTVFRDLILLRREGRPSITGFMSDQKPSHGDAVHVVRFLNHPTAMITGTEAVARRLDLAAIYWDMEKLSRGHYKITCRLMSDDVRSMPEYALTDAYARMLETTIRRNPSIWLWTHKRWKHPVKFPDDE